MSLSKKLRLMKSGDLVITPDLTMWMMRNPNFDLDDAVADIIRTEMVKKQRDRRASFSSSSAGNCERAQLFDFLGLNPTKTHPTQLQNIFYDGQWRHLRWQAMLLQAGLLTDIEIPLSWPAKRSKGSMDGMGVIRDDHPHETWRGLEFGFELKGANSYAYTAIVQEGPRRYMDQVHRYFLSGGFDLFVILVENKNTQEWTEWVIEPDDILLQEQTAELDRLNSAVDTQTFLPMLDECQLQKGKVYNSCPHGKSSGLCGSNPQWPTQVTK